jgi:CRP/FNR family transcriptional regulator
MDFESGDVIFEEGETVEGIFQIYSGRIKVVANYLGVNERVVRLASSEQLLGHRGFGGQMIYPVTAIALEKSQVTFIPLNIFYSAVKANPELAFNLMMFFADELKSSEKNMRTKNKMSAKEKVISAINMIIEAFGFDENDPEILGFTPSRKDIASIAGTTYETVIRVLSALEKSGCIVQEGKTLRILDSERLGLNDKTFC